MQPNLYSSFLLSALGPLQLSWLSALFLFIDTSENPVYIKDSRSGPPPGCCNTGMQ
jgi:hypothetical protein